MIQGKDINLWAVERTDLIQNYSWANDPDIIRTTGMVPYPKSSWDIERWFESLQGNNSVYTYSIKKNNGEYIGNIELSNVDWRIRKAEIGIMIGDPSQRGKGIGVEAINLLTGYAFQEFNLHRIYARILAFNKPALRAFEKCGYIKEGVERSGFYTEGKYEDIVSCSILKDEFIEKKNCRPD